MLAPDKKIVEELLVQFMTSFQSITLAAISLKNTQFYPLDPPPDWMTKLETNLNTASAMATDWLLNQGPTVSSQTPQYFITYSESMQVVASNMQNATTKAQALSMLNRLKGTMQGIPANELALQGIISKFSTDFKPYHTNIEAALSEAASTITTDQAAVKELTDKINTLYQEIAEETAKANGGNVGIPISATSLGVAVIAITYSVLFVTLNPFAVVGACLALGGLTVAAVVEAINRVKIEEHLEELKPLQMSLLEENQAIAILQTLTVLLQSLDKALIGIQSALDMSPIWSDESGKLDAAIANLNQYTDANFKTMPEIQSLSTAAATWTEVGQMAQNVQKALSGMAITSINFKQS